MHHRQDPSADLRHLASLQGGALSTEQVAGHRLPPAAVTRLVRAGHWHRLARGVYSIRQPDWTTLAWAGTLAGGDAARLGGLAALHLRELVDDAPDQIDVWTPRGARSRVPGPWRFREERPGTHSGPTFGAPPHLGVPDAILDVAGELSEEAYLALVIAAVQRRRCTPAEVLTAAHLRPRLARRALLRDVLADAAAGAHSPLERAYLSRVERAHHLPCGIRQHRRGRRFRDVYYEQCGVVVELDSAWHDGLARFHDMSRDNLSVLDGDLTLRFGWTHVVGEPCVVAHQVAQVLAGRGWDGAPSRCPSCLNVPSGVISSW